MARTMPGPFIPYRMPIPTPLRNYRVGVGRLRGLGAAVCNVKVGVESTAAVTAGVTAASAIAAGAAAGSVIGPVGTAVGAVAGIVSGLLAAKPNTAAHIGSWDTQLVNALAQLPSTVAGIGRQFPWNNDGNGLTQMIEALLAVGEYAPWDSSIISNYDVCAHWATTLATMVQTVATAVCKNAKGASVTVSLTSQPGGPVGPGNFTFTNPGILVGPEAVTNAVIMGSNGCMVWMFNRWQIASTAALSKTYAATMGSNAAAAKVYALMVDYVAGSLNVADAATPVPDVTSVPAAAATAAKTATTTTTATPVAPPTVTVPTTAPNTLIPATTAVPTATTAAVATPATTAAPVAATATVPATSTTPATTVTVPATAASCPTAALTAVLQQLEAQGADTSQPEVQAAAQQAVATATPATGLSTNTLLLVGGLGLLAWYLMKK